MISLSDNLALLSTSAPLVGIIHFLMSMFGAVDCCLRAVHYAALVYELHVPVEKRLAAIAR